MSGSRRIYIAIVLFGSVMVIGTIGYTFLEGADPLTALYMTVITVAAVGYEEKISLDTAGRLFTIALILAGLVTWTLLTVTLIAFWVEGEFQKIFRYRKLQKRIGKMKNHFIICGLGQVGQSVLAEFSAVKAPCVVLERDPAVVEELAKHYPDLVALVGDATTDELLEAAHVDKAQGLIAAAETDSDNLLIVLTARSKNKNLVIAARAARAENYNKLRVAGANHVIMPNVIGGIRMASTLLRPQVVDFLDVMSRGSSEGDSLRMEQACIPGDCSIIGMTLQEADIPRKTGLLILAIKRESGAYIFSPCAAEKLVPGDTIILLGPSEKFSALNNVLGIENS